MSVCRVCLSCLSVCLSCLSVCLSFSLTYFFSVRALKHALTRGRLSRGGMVTSSTRNNPGPPFHDNTNSPPPLPPKSLKIIPIETHQNKTYTIQIKTKRKPLLYRVRVKISGSTSGKLNLKNLIRSMGSNNGGSASGAAGGGGGSSSNSARPAQGGLLIKIDFVRIEH